MCTLVLASSPGRRVAAAARGQSRRAAQPAEPAAGPPLAGSPAGACRARRRWRAAPGSGVNDDGLVAGRAQPARARWGRRPASAVAASWCWRRWTMPRRGAPPKSLRALDPVAWRPFNLIVADAIDAFWLRHAGDGAITPAADRGRPAHDRGRRARRPGLAEDRALPAAVPLRRSARPGEARLVRWEALLADRTARTSDPRDAMCIVTDGDYGTVSSALVALSRHVTQPSVFRHAEGRPGEAGVRRRAGLEIARRRQVVSTILPIWVLDSISA